MRSKSNSAFDVTDDSVGLQSSLSELLSSEAIGELSTVENQSTHDVVDTYRKNIFLLENRVKELESEVAVLECALLKRSNDRDPGGNAEFPEVSEDDWVNEIVKLQEQLAEERARADKSEQMLKSKEKEFEQFIISGGTIGGDIRDKILRTLQDQIAVRDEEIEFYKNLRSEGLDEQRKNERLLISAVHALSLRYHEEMVNRVTDENEGPAPDTGDFFAQEYKIK